MKRININRIKLTRQEREIEEAMLRGEYVKGSKAQFDEIAQALAHRKKNAVLNIRVNNGDLQLLKDRARRHGIRYQTFIAELLHRVAHS